jgi:D-sedoheptulose 7-phosphate isomerase
MLGTQLDVGPFLDRVCQELKRMDPGEIRGLADAIFNCYQHGRTVFICGNGGSGSNASHFCEDLGKGTLRREDFDNDARKRIRVISLTDNTPYILAWGNDEGFDRVFVEQLKNLAQPKDLLIAISGSGNSPNVLRAVDWANQHGLMTVGCTGFKGGKLKGLSQKNLHVDLDDMGIVESVHLTVFHWIIDNLYKRISL